MEKDRQIRWLGAFLCALLWSAPLRAAVIRLADLEAQALRKRHSIAVTDARIAQAKARIEQARSAYMPKLSLNGDASLSPGSQLISVRLADIGNTTTSGNITIVGS